MLLLSITGVFLYFVPGLLLIHLLNIRRWRFFISLGLSLLLFAICLAPLLLFSPTWLQIATTYLMATLFLAGLALRKILRGKHFKIYTPDFKRIDLVIFSSILLAYGIYILLVGPYNELPSDFYRHLERIQLIRWNLESPESRISAEHLKPNGYYWYYLFAVTWRMSGASLENAISFFSWLNGAIVISSVYFFSTAWLARTFKKPTVLAVVACLLFVVHMGVIHFAFIRYYALSATMLSLPMVFLSITAFVQHTEIGLRKIERVAILGCLIMLVFYHVQEFLFVMIFLWSLSAYFTFHHFYTVFTAKGWSNISESFQAPVTEAKHIRDAALVFIIASLAFLLVFGFAQLAVPLSVPDTRKLTALSFPSVGIKLGYVLNPEYQFFQTIGAYGVLIYVGFLLLIRKFLKDAYLLTGLLIPFVTIFNPFFVDAFLRVRDTHVLYRIGYMLPLAVSGAYILGLIWTNRTRQGLKRWLLTGAWLIACSVTLLPSPSESKLSTYSRLPTLTPVPRELSYQHWMDMISFLRKIEPRTAVYTDPVTGYIVSSLTQHESVRYKFTTQFQAPINFLSYDQSPLASYKGGLLIVNRREGGASPNGLASGHWPVDVLKLRQYYSSTLLQHLMKNPEVFPVLWAKNDIAIYRIYP